MLAQYFLNFLIWEATTVLTYVAANLSFKPIHCSSNAANVFSHCCEMTGRTFEVSHNDFTIIENRINLRFIMLYSLSVFFLGNKYFQIDPLTDVYTLLYIIIPPAAAFAMSYMSNVKGLQTSCSKHSISKWPVASWVVYGLSGMIAIPSIIYNFYFVYVDEGLEDFLCYLVFIVLIAAFEFTLYKIWDKTRDIHLHHLFIGTMGATLLRANTPFVIPLALTLYGVGIEGASNYGFPDIFEDE